MKIIALKTNLKNGLSVVERATAENASLPILKNILIKAENGKIRFTATNLEVGVNVFISGKVLEDGGITVPVGALANILSYSESERINLETEKNILFIKTDNYEAKIQGLSDEDFPTIPRVSGENLYLKINGLVLKDALLKVLPAATISEIRPEISGILFDFQLTSFKFAATDTFRLAEKTILNKFETNMDKGFRVIVPLKAVQEVVRVFPDAQEILISVDSNQILFKNNELEFMSRLIDGNYPDYTAVVPKEIETEMVVEKEYFLNALKLTSGFSTKNNEVRLKLSENQKVIEVYSSNQQVGENRYLVPVKVQKNGFTEIVFNWRFMLDGLKLISSDKIFFGINSSLKPAVIKSGDDPSFFYILMPINLGQTQ